VSHHIVHIENLSYDYPDGTKALQGVTFEVVHGEAVAIVGANGAGKSTLLMHLNGTLPPGSGRVIIGDLPVTERTARDVRRTVGMVFSNPDDQLFMPTVGDDVAFGPLNLGLQPEDVAERVRNALEKVGAAHLADRPPYRLSSGEKRLASIATVLAMEPSILVMDEPSSHLDPWARRRLIELLGTFDHSKIIATHDLDLVLDLCPRTIVMCGGQIAADGKTEEIFRNAALLHKCRLEKPLSWKTGSGFPCADPARQ
jgi:cobalt/nickel transport system ATP-binding protein